MPILEFYAVNPLAIGPFGMSLYFLLMHIPIIGGFGMAAYYIIKYLRRFYGERPIPEFPLLEVLEWLLTISLSICAGFTAKDRFLKNGNFSGWQWFGEQFMN